MDHKPFQPPQPNPPNVDPNQPTVPSGSAPRYDYSHLRESKDSGAGHWYAYPDPSTAATQPSAMAAPNPTPSMNEPSVPPVNPPMMPPPQYPMPAQGGRAARQRIQQRRRKNDNWAWVVIAITMLGVTIICGMVMVIVIQSLRGDEDTENLANVPLIEPTSIIYQDSGGALDNSLQIQGRKWTGQERFTILLMGLDKRPGEEGTVFRTDTMILVSLDPQNNTIGMLSIPRDLYVEVPYYGLHRVNSAYVLGELEQVGNGATLAKQTVQYNFGIAVNEYVTVDFNSVIAIIDAIGGIEIEVPKAIIDYQYPTMDYGTEVFQVEAGWQTMDGITALKYARTRHASDDIDRAARQQAVIYAVRDKVTSLDMIDDLVVQSPFLYGELQDGIKTGLTFDQMIELAIWASEVPRENIHNGVVSWEYLIGYQTPGGASVLVPDRAQIGQLMIQVFGENYNQ